MQLVTGKMRVLKPKGLAGADPCGCGSADEDHHQRPGRQEGEEGDGRGGPPADPFRLGQPRPDDGERPEDPRRLPQAAASSRAVPAKATLVRRNSGI